MSSPRSIQSKESAEEKRHYPDITQDLDAPPSEEEHEPSPIKSEQQTSSPEESISVRSAEYKSNKAARENQAEANQTTSPVHLDRPRTRSFMQKSSSERLIVRKARLIAMPDNNTTIPQSVKLELEEMRNKITYLSKLNEELVQRLNVVQTPNSHKVIRNLEIPNDFCDSGSVSAVSSSRLTKQESDESLAKSNYSFGPKSIMKRD